MKLTFTLALLIAMSGCSARRFDASGMVLEVDGKGRRLVVSHDAIEGLMDAMVMPFEVAPSASLPPLQPGDRIAFRLSVDQGNSRIDRVRRVASTRVATPDRASQPIRPGQSVPDFELIDHHGSPVRLSQLQGKVVVVNFIYTRCPLPDYCPRLTTHFRALQERFAAELPDRMALLTVSFDPGYDTPEVLTQYAIEWKAGPGWRFLTGDRQTIFQVCSSLGVEYWPDEGLLTHTMTTAVIAPDGRLAASIDGSDFDSGRLLDLVSSILGSSR